MEVTGSPKQPAIGLADQLKSRTRMGRLWIGKREDTEAFAPLTQAHDGLTVRYTVPGRPM